MAGSHSARADAPVTREPLVVTIGVARDTGLSWAGVRRVDAVDEGEVLECITQGRVAVLVLGPRLRPADAHRLVRRSATDFPDRHPRCIVSGAGAQAGLFQDTIDDDAIYYLSRGVLGEHELRALVIAAAFGATVARPRLRSEIAAAAGADVLLDTVSRLSLQTDVTAAAALVSDAVRRLAVADDAHCLFEERTQTLWSREEPIGGERRDSAAAGIVGYVARTGWPVAVARCDADPRFDAECDDPRGGGSAHLVAEPIVGADGAVLAIVSALRREGQFSPLDRQIVADVAVCAAPILGGLALEQTLRERVIAAASTDDDGMYRREAVEWHAGGGQLEGRLLETAPRWMRMTLVLLVAVSLSVLGVIALIRIPEYASGGGVVRSRSAAAVTAPVAGRVEAIAVAVGQYVEAGALVGRITRLADAVPEPLWSPARGVVVGLERRPGQMVSPGDRVATIVDETAGYEFLALLPATYESHLSPGMPLFFRIHGFADAPQMVRIDEIGPVLLTRSDAAQVAGDFVSMPGPAVVVRSRLPPTLTAASGRSVRYRQGMTGDADVRVSADSGLASLFPALKQVTR
jgi:hypothetical protein